MNAVMPDLFRHLSMNGNDPDPDPNQSGQDDSGYYEIAVIINPKAASIVLPVMQAAHYAGTTD